MRCFWRCETEAPPPVSSVFAEVGVVPA